MEEKKKIIVIGKPSDEIMAQVIKFQDKYNLTVEYRELQEGESDCAIAEGFDPNPPKLTLPFVATPYLNILEDVRSSYLDWIPSNGKPHSKYARPATQEELDAPKLSRNEPCHCGSGLKFKKCHGK